MKKLDTSKLILITAGGLTLQILLGIYLVEEWIFGDSFATTFEQIMYHMAVLPPFIIAVLFYKETQKLSKSLGYAGLFYMISLTLVTLYHFVPTKTDYPGYEIYEQTTLGSYGFYVTGGGIGPIAVLPQILLTILVVFSIHRASKS